MIQPLKSLTRIATAAVLTFTMGCGAAEEVNTEEASTAVGTISQDSVSSTFTVRSWPSAFPLTAGAPEVAVLIPFTSGSNIQITVSVEANGTVNIKNFQYAATAAINPNHTYTSDVNPVPWFFAHNGQIGYNIKLSVAWSGSIISLIVSANVIPGGSISAGSTTLCILP